MYFFPLISLYFPIHLEQFFTYLQVSNIELENPLKTEYSERIGNLLVNHSNLKMGIMGNQKFVSQGFSNTAIVTNIGDSSLTML